MQLLPTESVIPNSAGRHPALRNFADECRAVFVRLLAYVGGLATLAVIAADLFSSAAPVVAAVEPPIKIGWTAATRPYPAFALSQFDSIGKTESYDILRHPDGGRKDTLRWTAAPGAMPLTEIEIYRPGGEIGEFGSPAADIAARMRPGASAEAEAAGMIDTKFGAVGLLRIVGLASEGRSCLAFAKTFDAPRIRISGWSCQADTPGAQRASLACILNRLTLLSAGNDPKLAELFARAELKRGTCATAAAISSDWVTGMGEPQLRGRL